MRVDLHTHTNATDGFHCFDELEKAARMHGIDWVVAADHDKWPEAFDSRHPLKIFAVEVTADFLGHPVHVLGYFNKKVPEFQKFLDQQNEKWIQKHTSVFNRARKMGFEAPNWAFPAWDLHKGLLDHIAGRTGKSRPAVYLEFFQRDKPLHLDITGFPTPEIVIDSIRECGGIPILAHLGAPDPGTKLTFAMVDDWVNHHGLRGLEVFSIFHSPHKTKTYRNYAHERNLLVTGGSDFHCSQWDGWLKENFESRHFGNVYVEGSELDRFLEALQL